MPYQWVKHLDTAPKDGAPGRAEGAGPIAHLDLWPYRSLPKRGFAIVILMAYIALLIPVSAFIGTLAIWWMLLPGLAAIGALYWFIERNYRDGEILEQLDIWPDEIRLTRDGPRGAHAEWEANIYWTTVQRHLSGGPVPDYITLKGAGREVEIGAFLSEAERPKLFDDLERTLVLAKSRHR